LHHQEKKRERKRRGKKRGKRKDFITLSEKQDSGIWLLKGNSGVLSEDYAVGELLGEGAFAKVYRGTHQKSGEQVAIKVIDKSTVGNEVSSLVAEVDILKKVKHKYVIELKDLYETKQELFIVTELAKGGELFNRILDKGAYSEKDAALLTKRILQGLCYLHERGIVHRDLKPENLLLANENDDFDIRIADFGLSKIIGNTTLIQSLAGSPNYVAPEVLDGLGYREWADMWSVGVITYILLCGYPPFACEDTRDLLEMIQAADYEYDPDYWSDISDGAKNFVDGLLTLDHNARLTAKDALEHPWLKTNADIKLDIKKELKTTISDWKGSFGAHAASSSSATASNSVDNAGLPPTNASSNAASSNQTQNFTVMEITDPSVSIQAKFSGSVPITQLSVARIKPSVSFYLFLYTEVGSSWQWKERSQLSTAQLQQIIADDQVEIYVAYVNGCPAGFAEIDFRQSTQKDGEVQLKHIGVMPEYIGKGVGKLLIDFVLSNLSNCETAQNLKRVWLKIASTDHPNTLAFFEASGFKKVLN